MNYFKILLVLTLLLNSWSSSAQNQQLKKADKLYKQNEFSEAITFYEEGLREVESLSAKTNLAYCYMMTNRLNNAEQLYSEIVNEERSRPITKYYYGETLMSNGKYEEAKNWFLKYAELNPKDERALEMAAACDKVKLIKPLFENIAVKPFPQNSESDDSGPVFYKDGIVFTSDRKSGLNPLKQKSGWTGRDFIQIYYCDSDSSGGYTKPQLFSKKLNEMNKHCGPICFSSDQSVVVFTKTGVSSGKNNTYNMQLYYSELNSGGNWKNPKVMPFCKKDHNYMHPALSPDGKTLYFVSDKPGGEGGTDIYKSKMTEKGWGTPLNLGTKVNTQFNEGFPFVSSDDKLYFSSKGHSGYGGFDIFVVEQDENGLWSKSRNVGMPINSSKDDISFHLDEKFTKGMFSSSRGGSDDNIYVFEITPATIINKEIDAPQEILMKEALQPINTNEVVAATEIDIEEGKPINQLKSNTLSSNGSNDIRMPDDVVQNNDTNVKASDESQIITEKTDEHSDNIVSNTNEKSEKTTIAQTGNDNLNHTSNETKPMQEIHEKEIENKTPKEEHTILDERMVDRTPATQLNPNASPLAPVLFTERPNPTVYPFVQINQLLKNGEDVKGKTFRMNGIQFSKGEYIISPENALKLNTLVDILERYPDLEIEIAAHTNSIGDDIENLEVSRARAGAIAAHLINRGIASNRINAEGYGENRLLNRCANGVFCSEKEHKVNERIELAIF